MKYSLKNEYKELLKEFRVSIETDEGYYDYEFDDTQSVDFKNLKFINKSNLPLLIIASTPVKHKIKPIILERLILSLKNITDRMIIKIGDEV